MRKVLAVAALILSGAATSFAEDAAPTPGHEGRWELGLFVPFGVFDTKFPVRDKMGENDAIRDTYGRGLQIGYNFGTRHEIETDNSWIDSDSEDMHGANFFSIRTRYNLVQYRVIVVRGHRWAPFAIGGLGAFRARALDKQHVSFSGGVLTAGGGLRLYTSVRSSMTLTIQEALVNLPDGDARNVIFSLGITSHIGRGAEVPRGGGGDATESPSRREGR